MNKTLEAFARGYLVFRVNDRWFLTYGRARAFKNTIPGSVTFKGFNVFKGWRAFFIREVH